MTKWSQHGTIATKIGQLTNGGRLEAEIGLEILGDLTNETLEWELADKQLGRLDAKRSISDEDGCDGSVSTPSDNDGSLGERRCLACSCSR